MRILVGIKRTQAMESMLEYRKQEMEFQIVETDNEFLFHLPHKYNIICIDSGIFSDTYPWVWMSELKKENPKAVVYVALDADIYDSAMLSIIEKLAQDYEFNIISIQISTEKTAYAFAKELFGLEQSPSSAMQSGKFVSVIPASPGDGATTIAINTALAIASQTKLRVGLFDGNLKNPVIRSNLNISDRLKNSFHIRSKLQTGTLDPAALENSCVPFKKIPNLFVLPGTHRRETASDVTPEMIYHLMAVARQTFHITIMDVSTFPDNAATVCGVRYSDVRFLVCQDNYASYRISWNEWFECYWRLCGISPKDFKLVVNRHQGNEKLDDMLGQLNMELVGKVPNVSGGLGVRAVNDGIPLYMHPGSEAFIQAVNQLAGSIAEDESMAFVAAAAESKRKSLLAKIFGK
jgi:pilus assembly protein CpaE